MGTRDEWSQWCDRLRLTDGPGDGFVLGKEVAAREKEEGTRLAREESQRQRAGRLFVARDGFVSGHDDGGYGCSGVRRLPQPRAMRSLRRDVQQGWWPSQLHHAGKE